MMNTDVCFMMMTMMVSPISSTINVINQSAHPTDYTSRNFNSVHQPSALTHRNATILSTHQVQVSMHRNTTILSTHQAQVCTQLPGYPPIKCEYAQSNYRSIHSSIASMHKTTTAMSTKSTDRRRLPVSASVGFPSGPSPHHTMKPTAPQHSTGKLTAPASSQRNSTNDHTLAAARRSPKRAL